jgi:hypothetical protein
MCLNCVSTVDAAALSAVGVAASASAGYQRLTWRWSEATRRRRARAVEHTRRFLEDGPPQSGQDPPAVLYTVALALYVLLGVTTKVWVLNWIVGPLFLLLVLGVVPSAARRLHAAVVPARVAR